MDEDDDTPMITQRFHFNAQATRYIDNAVFPFIIEARALFDYHSENEDEIVFCLEKIQYWIDHVLDNSVMFSVSNKTARSIFLSENQAPDNMMIITPDDPDDDMFLAVVLAKLQALGGDHITFGSLELTRPNRMGISSIIFNGADKEPCSLLPSGEDWFGDAPRRYFDKPWWERDDGSSFDALPSDNQDHTVRPAWAFDFEFLREKHPITPNRPKPTPPTGGVGFVAKIIDGGKK
jgi:hypothetical protein